MGRTKAPLLIIMCLLVIAAPDLFSIGVMSQSQAFEDEKTYYSPDPHTPPPGSGSHRGGGSTPTPSHGHPSPPHHGHGGGGGYTPTPSTPSGGNCGNCGTTPHKAPSHGGGGGYYPSPPSHGGGSPPSSTAPPSPTTPVIVVSPPTTTPPIDPGTPVIPTPPFFPAPSGPIGGTCDFWRNHPGLIWGVLGWWGTVGSSFGVPSIPGFGANMSLQEALSNTRRNGFGELYRQGSASLLNSMANHNFPYTTKQVRESFIAALSTNRAAAAQARLFKLANEGHVRT